MAQFDVYQPVDGGLLLDCQADLFQHFNTRIVIPLLPSADAPSVDARLHPQFTINGETYVLMPEFASAVAIRALGGFCTSLARERYRIMTALDLLLTGS